ncbi:MAG: PHB depolymerase family esterase [Myxococcaceae bacterium]
MRWLPMVVVVLSCGLPAQRDEVGTSRQALDSVTGFGSNPGGLSMYRFVPTGLPRGRPLVVLLHGCTDTATNFSSTSGFEALATPRQFALLVPQQSLINNGQLCFNWFDSGDQTRGAGEMLSIVQMVDRMVTDVGSDPQQVFIAGFSAGAAETVNVIATHPDRFRAAVVSAGIPFKCTESLLGSSGCINGVDSTPQVHGMRVRNAFSAFTGTYPRVSIWQGMADPFVSPMNRLELMQQWTNVHGIDQTADGTMPITTGGTRSFFRLAPNGDALVELNEVPGAVHEWRAAWAPDMADFFGLTAPVDGGMGGGAAGGGTATAGGSAAGGTAPTAGGTASAGGTTAAGGTASAGGSAGGAAPTAGGTTSSAGGSATAGGTAGGGVVMQPMGCQSCSSAPGMLLLGMLAFLRRASATAATGPGR